jgi:hypothetical protein
MRVHPGAQKHPADSVKISYEECILASETDGVLDGGPMGRVGLAAQDVLPFPPTPSASRAGRTMQESSYQNPGGDPDHAPPDHPYWMRRVHPRRAKIATAGMEARRRDSGERELLSALTTDGGTDG